MSDSEVLAVRFHFNGVFVLDGSSLKYCNGDEGVSYIDKDKLSIPELEGHLLDHTTFKRSVRMYWLPFGAAVNTGMRLLVDDKSCLDMLDAVGSIGAVDIYTEFIDVDMAAMSGTDLVDAVGDEAVFDLFRDENVLNLDPASTIIDVQLGDQTAEDDNILCLDAPATHEDAQKGTEDEHEDEGDTDCDVTGFTSDEDDEAKEIRTNYKAYMSKRKKREGIPLDTPTSMDLPTGIVPVNNFGDGIAYFDSDEDVSYDDDSETDAKRRKCRFPIFDSRAETPQFSLDMCFRSKKELKDAIERYALKKKNSASGNNPGHSHGPSSFDNNNAPLAIEPATSKGKGTAASSETKSNKRKAIEGYGLYYSDRTGSSFIQTGKKSRLVSFGTSNSKAKASAFGNASVVVETSAGHPTSSARATINVTGGRATAEIKSTSTARGGQKKSG